MASNGKKSSPVEWKHHVTKDVLKTFLIYQKEMLFIVLAWSTVQRGSKFIFQIVKRKQ